MNKKKVYCLFSMFMMVLTLGACGSLRQPITQEDYKQDSEIKNENKSDESTQEKTDFLALSPTKTFDLSYATQFRVDTYGCFHLITIADDGRFLLIPEGVDVPDHVPEDVIVLQQPLNHTYLVSTSVLDLLSSIDCLSNVNLTGTKKEGWHIPEAVQAFEQGQIEYAGKYNAPDYELILNKGCNLAIENTMIYHNPEVKEKLEDLGIPVFVERSSYEEHPLGRLEWIKLYGLMYGKEEEAQSFYQQELAKLEPIMKKSDSGKKVAFFYVTSNGAVNVRKPDDYIAKMITLSGGNYIIKKQDEEENALSTMNMQMEDFYVAAKDCDIIIYNSTIAGEITSISDLIDKSSLFADFKAVKEGNVYCTSNDFFQKCTGIGDFMVDLDKLFTDMDTEKFTYLNRLR